MSEVVQERIVEQTSDDNKLEVSVDKVENTPTENNEKINCTIRNDVYHWLQLGQLWLRQVFL